MLVTVFENLYSHEATYHEASKVVDAFRNRGEHYPTIEKIRSAKTKDEKDEAKKTLPIVCFGGAFEERKKDKLKKGSGLLTLDFDDGNLEGVREKLEKWNCTYACFTSPSGGDRFKALIRIPEVKDDNEYKEFFSFFEQKYKVLDPSGKDVGRAAFITYDENTYLNPNAKVFTREMLNKYGSRPPKKTESKLLDTIANWMAYAPQGERQHTACKVGYYSGGLCATGTLDERETLARLLQAAEQRGGEVEQSKRAIQESFDQGKERPILDIREVERQVRSMKPKVDVKSFIVSREKIDEEAKEYYEGSGLISYKTDIPELDHYFSYRPNTFYTVTGGRAAGKTTLKMYINTFYAKKHGLKYLILSFENDASEIEQEVIGFLTGHKPEYVYAKNRALYKKCSDFFHEHFTMLNFPPDYRFLDIIEAAKQINSQNDYHELMVDPLFKIAGTDDYSENKLIARHAEPFANEEMSLWVQMHPTGAAQRGGEHISDLNAEFGSLYSNAADITLAISRFYTDPDPSVRSTVNMSIDKVRSKKMKGGMETVKNCPIKWEYKWKENNYDLWIPSEIDPNHYIHLEGGLLSNRKKELF